MARLMDDGKPLLIGEASADPSGRPFDGRPGLMLASLCGLSLEEFLDRVQAVNLLTEWPGRGPGEKGHLFPPGAAALAASRMDVGGRRIILAGKRVALAFGLKGPPWIRSVRLGRGEASCHVIPHPSGIVRWYNDQANGRRVGRLLRKLLREDAS